MRIAIGCDHVAYPFKREIMNYLEETGYNYEDFGTFSEERTDYPIYAEKVAKAVSIGDFQKGILICGTGVGISIAANKVPGIRAVVCSEPFSAVLSRQHNNTNILAIGSRVVGIELAKMIVREWLEAEFEGGRHQKRIDMIAKLEKGDACG